MLSPPHLTPTTLRADTAPRMRGGPTCWEGASVSLDLPLPDDEQATLVAYDPASGAPRAAIDRDTWATLEDSMPRDLLGRRRDPLPARLVGLLLPRAPRPILVWDMGADLYAPLDLRGYGRNLDPERVEKVHSPRPDDDEHVQRPGYITDLAEYDADLEAALAVIEETSPGRGIIVSGHSTGGLVAVLWADRNPGRLSGITLNSPWLEFQYSTTIRKILQPFLGARTVRHDCAAPPHAELLRRGDFRDARPSAL